MIVKPSTLEDLGWIACWDAEGKNPIKEGDTFKVTPGGTVDICYTCRPKQHENGKWYSNRLFIHKPVPGVIGGVYKKERITNTSFVCGDGTSTGAIDGRVEEISYWGKSLGEAGLIDYQVNKTSMIGTSEESMYETVQDAIDDKLYFYYNFSDSAQVIKNFTNDGGIALKSGFLEVGAGKNTNSTVMHGRDENIRIEQHHSEPDISINIRFFLEKYKDFVLYSNNNTFDIRFDASNETFHIKCFPYVGNSITYAVEVINIGVHKWHDFGIDYSDGVLSIIIDGEKVKEYKPNIALGGVESLILDLSNVEAIELYGIYDGLKLYPNNTSASSVMGVSSDPETNLEGATCETLYFNSGAKNAFNLLFDRSERRAALITWAAHDYTPDVNVIDPVTDRIGLDVLENGNGELVRCSNAKKYWNFRWEIAEESDGKFSIRNTGYVSGGTYPFECHKYARTYWHNFLYAGLTIRIRVRFKNQLTSEEPVFPMVTLFPGSKVKVDEVEMDPGLPSRVKQDIINSGNWGYYNGDVNKPGFRNTSGRTLVVRVPNTSSFTLVWDGYICYRSGNNVYQTSFDPYNNRTITRNDSVDPGFSIEVPR